MKSGEEKISFMLTRDEIEAIVNTFDEVARRHGYFSTRDLKETFTDVIPAIRVYEKMQASLELMDMLEDAYGD